MKKIKKFLIGNIKTVIAFIIGFIISGTAVYATTRAAAITQIQQIFSDVANQTTNGNWDSYGCIASDHYCLARHDSSNFDEVYCGVSSLGKSKADCVRNLTDGTYRCN